MNHKPAKEGPVGSVGSPASGPDWSARPGPAARAAGSSSLDEPAGTPGETDFGLVLSAARRLSMIE